MAFEPIASRVRRPGLLATRGYARLWFAGGVGNAMRWLELLVAGIFTYDLTHSAFLVAVVTVTRSLPMLFLGPIAGVVAEALNRKRLLLVQLFGMAVTSAVLALLAWSGGIRVWHIALGGAVTGIAWASELAVRRRMLGEVVPADQVVAAVALDSLTNSVARVLGPLFGGALSGGRRRGARPRLPSGAAPVALWPHPARDRRRPRRRTRHPGDPWRRAGHDRHEHIGLLLFGADRADRYRCVSRLADLGGGARRGRAARRDHHRRRAGRGVASPQWRPLLAARVIPLSRRGHPYGAVALVRARLCAVADRWSRHRRVFQHADEPHPRGGAARHPLAGDGHRDDVHRHRTDRRLDDRRAVGRNRSACGDPGDGRDRRRRAQPHRPAGARAALTVACGADRRIPSRGSDSARSPSDWPASRKRRTGRGR